MTLTTDETIDLMARVLRCRKVDLANDFDVTRALQASGRFMAGDILVLGVRAVERAHLQIIEHGDFQ